MNHMFVALFIVGTVIGSFINVIIYRLPKSIMGESISLSNPNRSFCPECKHTLSVIELIPLLSYLLQHGKCRHCNQSISIQYPAIEIICGILTSVAYIKFSLNLELIFILIFIFSLLALFWIDVKHQLLPDAITLPLIAIGLVFNYPFGFVEFTDALIGTIIGYLILWAIFWAYKLIRKVDGMGYGDFKLVAALGAWFGWQSLPVLLLSASTLGIVFFLVLIRDRGQVFAFGPFLIISALAWLFISY
jgi:leader peptidase (prepilin peptidase)/N-methyltransferase